MSKINRRTFLKSTSLVTTSMMVPGFLQAIPTSLTSDSHRNIVVIQLSGGNDGLNTIVPYHNDHYYENRPGLGLKENDLIKLHSELGFHKNLYELANLFDDGNLSIINNVGYPNPSRSHFRSMDIWQTGSDADQYLSTGWIGRFLDSHCSSSSYPEVNALEVNEVLSPALKGTKIKGMALKRPEMLFQATQHPFLQSLAHQQSEHSEANYLYKTFASTANSADYVYQQSRTYRSKHDYPNTKFGKELKTVAQLINSRLSTKIYYVSLSGFDTHAMQKNAQARLLKQYSEGVGSFVNDLKANDTFKDTLVMTFSEFGRRVKENASNGTDHGAANNLFVIGENLKKKGFYNDGPNLSDLDNGDLKYEIDFRQVYATVIENWLKLDSEKVLGRCFEGLSFI